MKIQNLAIIFLAIALPILLVLSEYIDIQSKAMSTKTKYDTAILNTAFDTIAAYEANSRNLSDSEAIGKQIMELEDAVSTFATSLGNNMGISGASKDYVLSRIPLVAFCMYDGYYIYMPNSSDSTDSDTVLKPYVYYTKTYTEGKANITISYSLDNYVSIYGTDRDGNAIASDAGYLIIPSDVEVSNDFAYIRRNDSGDIKNLYKVVRGSIKYKEQEITVENLYENKDDGSGVIQSNVEETTWDAMMYYYDALNFTQRYNEIIENAFRTSPDILEKLLIDENNDPESNSSNFRDEKVDVIKESLMSNINVGIYNYEVSGGGSKDDIETPEIKEDDWEKILNNVSVITFMKDIPLNNLTTYNNYVVVNSTLTNQYVSPDSLSFLTYTDDDSSNPSKTTGYYHNITCTELINLLNSNTDYQITGYASRDFQKFKYATNNNTSYDYYFKHNEYAAYECEVESMAKIDVSNIQQYLNKVSSIKDSVKTKITKSYYTAIARIRYRSSKSSSYVATTGTTTSFTVKYHKNSSEATWDEIDNSVYQFKKESDGYSVKSEISGNNIGKIYAYNSEGYLPTVSGKKFIGWSLEQTIDLQDKSIDELYSNNILFKDGYNGETTYIYGEGGQTIDLYAQYVDIGFLNLNSTGGAINGNTATISMEYAKNSTIEIDNLNAAIRDGYTLVGWGDKESSDNNYDIDTYNGNIYKIGEGAKITLTKNKTTLYAIWSEKEIEVSFYIPNNTLLENIKISKGTYFKTINFTPSTQEGYTFSYWMYKGTKIDDDYIINESISLYAKLEIIEYDITYNLNDGKLYKTTSNMNENDENDFEEKTGTITEKKKYGIVYQILNEKMEKEGYTFIGWSTNQNDEAGDKKFAPGAVYEENKNLTLYAIWQGDQYKVIYDANVEEENEEVKNMPETQTSSTINSMIISSKIPTRDGYEFAGWSTSSVDDVVEYKANSIYGVNEEDRISTYLYAIWEPDQYTISYDLNGGAIYDIQIIDTTNDNGEVTYSTKVTILETSIPSEKKYKGETIQIKENNVQKIETFINEDGKEEILKYYELTGWKDTYDNKEYQIGDEFTADRSATLVAQWGEFEGLYTITYDIVDEDELEDLEEEIYTPLPQSEINGYEINITEDKPIKGEAEFLGWSTTKYGEVEYNTGSSYTGTEDITLYAQWNYKIDYNMNIENTKLESSIKNFPSSATVRSGKATKPSIPTLVGYNFKGWALESSGSVKYSPGDEIIPIRNMTLYAIWEVKSYSLVYNINTTDTVSNVPTGGSYAYGSSVTLSKKVPIRKGYAFLGWSTNKNEVNPEYSIVTSMTMTMPAKDVTLYAIWEVNKYALGYDSNTTDTTVSNVPTGGSYAYGANVTVSTEEPTRTGYIFLGWSEDPNIVIPDYKTGSTNTMTMPANNVTLYAIWRRAKILYLGYDDRKKVLNEYLPYVYKELTNIGCSVKIVAYTDHEEVTENYTLENNIKIYKVYSATIAAQNMKAYIKNMVDKDTLSNYDLIIINSFDHGVLPGDSLNEESYLTKISSKINILTMGDDITNTQLPNLLSSSDKEYYSDGIVKSPEITDVGKKYLGDKYTLKDTNPNLTVRIKFKTDIGIKLLYTIDYTFPDKRGTINYNGIGYYKESNKNWIHSQYAIKFQNDVKNVLTRLAKLAIFGDGDNYKYKYIVQK
jgi:uncharacterized repeat protein (TIGR02543 family)